MRLVSRKGNRARGIALFLISVCACGDRVLDAHDGSGGDEPTTGSSLWGVYDIGARRRSGWEVLERARLIATIVLEDETLPSVRSADPEAVAVLENRAAVHPNDPITHRFELNGRKVMVWYLPSPDMLRIGVLDAAQRPTGPLGSPVLAENPDPGIGERAALGEAVGCLSALERKNVIPANAYPRVPTRTSSRLTHVPSIGKWVTKYQFAFHPSPDGLPPPSAEVLVEVNARTGGCQTIHVASSE